MLLVQDTQNTDKHVIALFQIRYTINRIVRKITMFTNRMYIKSALKSIVEFKNIFSYYLAKR